MKNQMLSFVFSVVMGTLGLILPVSVTADVFSASQIDTNSIVLEQRGDLADVYYPTAGGSQFPVIAVLQGALVDKSFYSNFGVALARYGFIVVIPNHLQELVFGPPGTPAITVPFPDQWVINDVLAQVEIENINIDSPLFGIVNSKRMAVVGHSAGGAAGLFALEESCNPPFCFGFYQKPQALIAGAFYGTNTCSAGGNASDTRCINGAATPPNPLGTIFDVQTEGLPVALVQGSFDGISTGEEAAATFEVLDGPRKLVTITGANHYGIANINNPPGAVPDFVPPVVPQDEAVANVAKAMGDYLSVHLNFQLSSSSSSNRLNPESIEDDTLSGNSYIFLSPIFPDTQISQVEFFIDGDFVKKESFAPYDLKGTFNNGNAASFNTRTLADGSHSLSAEILFSSGGMQTITNQFETLNNGFKLFVSESNDRSKKFPLESATLSGNVYVFLAPLFPDQNISHVDFYLDGSFVKREWRAPFDLKGTWNNGNAVEFDTSALSSGSHKVRAKIKFSNGTKLNVSSSFEVSN